MGVKYVLQKEGRVSFEAYWNSRIEKELPLVEEGNSHVSFWAMHEILIIFGKEQLLNLVTDDFILCYLTAFDNLKWRVGISREHEAFQASLYTFFEEHEEEPNIQNLRSKYEQMIRSVSFAPSEDAIRRAQTQPQGTLVSELVSDENCSEVFDF